ncbi:hydrogenase nickel incorporation protein HypB [Dehalobacter sp. DCM]|uniref:hydrogenase nickel incorporation protein HypB n=1 Tax=Dehalobacter sp. DCM TaxID=2907827 RepID=UPI003081C9F9|nr:hydrogenase nickel incorporation protein HypB [Dehalobacter sp. DCM]
MDSVKIIEIKQSIFENNDMEADKLRDELKKNKTFLLNLMSSPGSGKTSSVLRIIEKLKNEMNIGVMEADIDSAVDAEKVAKTGIKAIQLHTGGMCHLDAYMTKQGIDNLGIDDLDFVILENVGNLVCPAEFDTGASKKAMILSVPEGDDKPLKYPLIFQTVDIMIINKIDCLDYFDFDLAAVRERATRLNPDIIIFEVSAKTGQGFDELAGWIRKEVSAWNN